MAQAKRKLRSIEYCPILSKRARYDRYLPNSSSNVAVNRRSLQRQKPNAFCSLEYLTELSQQNSSEVTRILIAQQEAFAELLESNLDPDWIVSTVAILSKVCSSSLSEDKFTILSIAAKVSFTRILENYLVMLQENRQFLSNVEEFFVNLILVFKSWIEIIPITDCKLLPKLLKATDFSISSVEKRHSVVVSDWTKSKIKTLIEKLNVHKEKFKQNTNEPKESPPNDFKQLTVYPTREEILTSIPTFVRKNIIEGSYDSVHHYLDVQFRLLKEDFLAPLRQGMAEYLKRKRRISRPTKFSNATIYPNVVFRSLVIEKGTAGVILDLCVKRDSNQSFSWDSNSFINGSLTFFTKDNFSSILCGRVIDKNLPKKQIVVGFESEDNNYDFNVSYLMVECKIFFEPYYQVLKALQMMSHLDFPMKSYLIDAVPVVESPDYLDTGSSLYEIEGFKHVNLFGDNWPTADQLHLDSTQYSTFKAALTQKFVVIQGPPGTGKTYLGLRIVKTLLRNSKFWYDQTPILIVSLTNHALDQFLEGLMSTTERILRVGGQSKNEKLEKFNLKNARRNYKGYNSSKNEIRCKLENLVTYNESLKYFQDYNYIIVFKYFANVDQNIEHSWFFHASNSELLAWLFPCQTSANSQFYSQTFTGNDENNFNGVDDVDAECKPIILVSISSIEREISKIQNCLRDMKSKNITQISDLVKKWELESYLEDLEQKLKYFKMRIQDRVNCPPPTEPPNVNYHSPHQMHLNDRWNLYFYWLNLYNQNVKNKYEKLNKKYTKVRNNQDKIIMQDMLVIGMTTTTAARLQTTLQELKCRIVFVEEAAEVLESHVTASLTSHCQHLILTGDHQQLRPSTADYRIGKKFNLEISMFERMVINKMQCNTLGVQHRMRPEIAQLIVPHIYPQLKNHDSVSNFPPITGINSSLFFIHHEHLEIEDGKSKLNLFESEYLISFACYLRLIGYEPEDITILSPYSSQMQSLRKESQKHRDLLNGVTIEVVDNYQGEQNKIILLSLVRNNRNGKIGFLGSENRVCVALSRAKEGLYIMGNMDLLCQNSEIWPKIKEILTRQNCLGNYLTVNCKFHQDKITKIRKPEDFDKALVEGCNEINCANN